MAKIDVDSNNDVLLADVNRYNELFYKIGKSSAEQTELSGLQSTLADYLLIASDYNDLVTQQNTNTNDIADKAENTDYTGTLGSASWTGTAAPYSQTVSVSGVVATDLPIIDVVMSGTYVTDELRNTEWGYIYRAVTSTDAITFYASTEPTGDLPFQAKVVK